MRRPFRISERLLCLAVAIASVQTTYAAGAACPPMGTADTHPVFDASQLKEGRFIYRTTLRGEALGEMTLEIRHQGERTVISMSAPEIAQSWKATVEKSFAPVAASLAMKGRKGPYEMQIAYQGSKVSGEEREAGAVRRVDAQVDGVVVDQRVDWAAMMAIKEPTEGSLALQVFDPSTGSSKMLGHIRSEDSALRLDYTLCKREHVEQYTVTASRELPRYMLREDMPNGLVAELVRIEP